MGVFTGKDFREGNISICYFQLLQSVVGEREKTKSFASGLRPAELKFGCKDSDLKFL